MASHHDGINDEVIKELSKRFGLGATGMFPAGKLTPDDRGELRFAIGEEAGKIILNFGVEVSWIAFTPEQAIDIANTLKAHADRIMGREGSHGVQGDRE